VVHFHRPQGRLACFPTGESPVVKVLLSHRFSGGEGGGASHQRGESFSLAPKARLYGFPSPARAVVWFYKKEDSPNHLKEPHQGRRKAI